MYILYIYKVLDTFIRLQNIHFHLNTRGRMDQADLLALFEELAPTALAAPWDNSGLQVASDRKEIHHIAISLDPSPESVQKALTAGADFIFTHHPLKLSPSYPNVLDVYHKILSLLFSSNVPLYSAHTNLDSTKTAQWLADELGLVDRNIIEVTGSHQNGVEAGIGVVGSLPHALDSTKFTTIIQNLIPHTHPFSCVGKLPKIIHRIGMCPGSGSSLMDDAQKLGAEVFITGDTKYHSALDATQIFYNKNPLCLIDVGHFSLEEEMMRRFSLMLSKKLQDIRVTFIPANDPFSQITE